jgi:hypothetical protein
MTQRAETPASNRRWSDDTLQGNEMAICAAWTTTSPVVLARGSGRGLRVAIGSARIVLAGDHVEGVGWTGVFDEMAPGSVPPAKPLLGGVAAVTLTPPTNLDGSFHQDGEIGEEGELGQWHEQALDNDGGRRRDGHRPGRQLTGVPVVWR